jgi:outer membrane protein OmpA-like peptidoglycan-associated protein
MKHLLTAFLFLFLVPEGFGQVKDSVVIELINLGKKINSAFGDYAPVISADGSQLLFTSVRPLTEKEIKKNKPVNERVFYSQFVDTIRKWNEAISFGSTINETGRNNSAIAISNDGQRMLLYRDEYDGTGDIYESVLEGTTWNTPVNIGKPVNSKFHESSASFSPDGRTLYFVSDRDGGIGGRDIWLSKKETNGIWSSPVNLGAVVNTKLDEEGVFLHPDGITLYFSSKGHNGLGGYDIYRSVLSKGAWGVPENLGAPLNSKEDDVYFVMEANGKVGYFASAIPGGNGEKDLYKVVFKSISKQKKVLNAGLILLKGVVTDASSGKPVEAKLELTDLSKNKELAILNSNSSSGNYLISLPGGTNYGIHVSAPGYLFHSENFNISDTSGFVEIIKNIQLHRIEVEEKIVLRNIFYDFDRASLRDESLTELSMLAKLIELNPTLKIEISSHTDNKGADEYNLRLSQERAQSVVDYLVSKGIDPKRLVAKGYGEGLPIAGNESDDGRQQNRRTEFKILVK